MSADVISSPRSGIRDAPPLHACPRLGDERVDAAGRLEVRDPRDGSLVGTVPMGGRGRIDAAVAGRARRTAGDPLADGTRVGPLIGLAVPCRFHPAMPHA